MVMRCQTGMRMTALVWLWAAAWLLTAGMARAETPAPAVPPHLEIEVLDPNVDAEGNPAVRLVPQTDGTTRVDIPPTVLVHRYFYTGNRSFQAQLLRGGPSIVVVNHPRTGERCYVPVQMLPGAPRVTYREHEIEYDYGHHAVSVHFGRWGVPKVTYRNGRAVGTRAVAAAAAVGGAGVQLASHAGLPTAMRGTAEGAKQAVVAAVGGLRETSKMALTPVVNALGLLPFGNAVVSGMQNSGEQAATAKRDAAVTHAAALKRRAEQSIPTLR